jgi:hypothetical protein
MKRFLILGEALDLHAGYVAWALGVAGYRTTLVNASRDNCPTRTTLYLDNVVDEFASTDWNDADAVWYRRLPALPIVDSDGGSDDDFILQEEVRFTKWLIQMHENSPSRWLNRPTAALAAENKFVQLKRARAHGLSVPRTLITAEPDRVRAFLKSEGAIVAKPLNPYSWVYPSGITLAAFATVIDSEYGSQLADEEIARCVTIYQQRIDKAADVRMVIMGEDIFAYKVIQEGEQYFDFRIGFPQKNHLTYESISIPLSLKKKVAGFMNAMNINFASADFALTPDSEFVFLDLNPNGQWLFIEESSPHTQVGRKFCSFFVKGRVDPKVEKQFPSLSDYNASDAAKSLEEAASPAPCRSNSTELVEEEPCGGITPTSAILAANGRVR